MMPRILIMILLAGILYGCNSSSNTSQPAVRFREDEYKDSLRKVGGNMHQSYTVDIAQMKFQPDNITVAKGDTIVFVNHDIVTHDITELTAKAWTSGNLPADASWKYVPEKSADYYCSIHPVMKGKITVQ